MAAHLKFTYDRESDVLYIEKCPSHAGQESEEIGDEVIARINPATGEVEGLEVLFFSARLSKRDLLDLPLEVDLRLAAS